MSHRPRTLSLLAALLAAVLVAGLFVGPPAGAAEPGRGKGGGGKDAARTWSGLSTPGVRTSGGFIGARLLDGAPVYRVDPRARKASKAYGGAQYVSTLPGATPESTARAAWIVSKYGAYKRKVQSAAVEVALDDLLVGGRFALKARGTTSRLAATGKARKITKFARIMLKGSIARAGDYTTTLAVPPSVAAGAGFDARVTVLAAGTGAPVASLPVAVSLPGQPAQAVETGADGTATVRLTAAAAGPQTVTAQVDRVPENRLLVRTPTNPKASPVVVAQVKTVRVLTASVAVVGTPTLHVAGTPFDQAGPGSLSARIDLSGGYASLRNATATLYGPFPSTQALSCTGPVREQRTLTVTTGPVALPGGAAAQQGGYYAWRVDVAGDAYNTAVSTCEGATLLHRDPVGLGFRPFQTTYNAGNLIYGYTSASYLPSGATTVKVRVFGPFGLPSVATCDPAYRYDDLVATIPDDGTGSGTVLSSGTTARPSGYFNFQTSTDATYASGPVTGPCQNVVYVR